MSSNSSQKPPEKRSRRKTHSKLTPMADVLQGLLVNSKSQLGDGFLRWRLEQEWSSVVGGSIAEQTLPCSFERGVLWVWVRHPAWMQQLWFFKEMIRDKANEHLGRSFISEVRFTLNRRAAMNNLPSES